ncbi:MAG TPA: tetratricopeptide repeat protein, partial [Acidobacteriaceae bacterium]|nr:tetratricopeptide repeat protein [Acidobacteriaceae bacterium]
MLRFGLYLAAPFLSLVAPAQTAQQVRERLQAAETDYQQRQYAKSESELRSILGQSPENDAANELLGLVLSAEGRDADATVFFSKAVRLNPASVTARENLAANYAKRGQNTLAEAEFKRLVQLDPENFDLNHNFGEFYLRLGKLQSAIPLLQAAQSLKPADYPNGYDLSLAEMMSGRLADAETQIRRLLEVQDTAELHSLLGEIYERQNQFLPAAKEFQTAVRMDPTEDAIFDWGTELLRHQNLQEASQIFTSGVHLYPRSWSMNVGLGVAEFLLGNNSAAVASLLRAVDLDPENPKSYLFLSKIDQIPASQSAAVTDRFEQYAIRNPKMAQAQLYYAANLWQADQAANGTQHLAKVESLLKNSIALDPK